MSVESVVSAPPKGAVVPAACGAWFGHPRDYLANRFVYAVISQRARGLSLGVNLTPDRHCNFDCAYCEVDHRRPIRDRQVDLEVLAQELVELLTLVRERRLAEVPYFRAVPAELLQLKEVALSGDGEPTLSPQFRAALETVVGCRARQREAFKIVLITNTSGLGHPEVEQGLQLLRSWDEIWVKLDAGTQAHMDRVNRAGISLTQTLDNILRLARRRPVVVQSLFPQIGGLGPSDSEITQYVERLQELVHAGAQIAFVQIYSAHRPPHRRDCAHLPLSTLAGIARRVRQGTGLRAEVF